MGRIVVVPESLTSLAGELRRAAGDLQAVQSRLGGALGSLDWEARQKAGVDGQVSAARSRASALAGEAEALAAYLAARAQAFLEADRQGASGLAQVPASGVSLGIAWPPRLPWPFTAIPLITLPTLRLPGLAWPPQIQLRPPRIAWPWGQEPELVSPLPDDATPRTTFGDLLKKPAPAEAQPASATAAAQTQTRWWLDVPTQSQQGLQVPGGQTTAYGCAPTAVSMVLDYWHSQDEGHKTLSPDHLVRVNVEQGQFKAVGGMSVSHLHDEIKGAGYSVVEDHVDATADDLRAAVAQGPVVALVKLGMGTTGDNHSVVVTGVSADGSQVRINDPWTGKSHTYSWEQFSRSWGADFGPNAPKNIYTVIRP